IKIDSNPRHPAPKAGALPGCAIPRRTGHFRGAPTRRKAGYCRERARACQRAPEARPALVYASSRPFAAATRISMRSGNPALSESTFLDLGTGTVVRRDAGAMTLNGTVNKTAFLLVLTLAAAMYTWSRFFTGGIEGLMPFVWGGLIGGLVVALVTVFKKEWSPVTAPLYAVLEGMAIGAISAVSEQSFPGIVMQAVGLTFGTLAALLLAYRSGLVRATENFKLGVVAATGGIMLLYLVNIGMRLFGFEGMGFIHDSGWLGIGFSAVVVVVAALNLVLDFDFIEQGVEHGAPKY